MVPITSIVRREVKTCSKDTSVYQAVLIMAEHDIGSIVIVEDKKPIGIFTERDLLKRVVAKKLSPEETKIEEVMTKDVIVAEEFDSCSSVFMKMNDKKIRHLPVVKDGNLIGIVSLKDVIRLMNDIIIKQMYTPDSSGMY